MAERTARIGKGKGPEVSPVLAATVISLLIGGLIGYTVRYFQVGYFSPAPLPDSMAASRSGQGGGGRPPGGGGGGGMARGGPLPGGGAAECPCPAPWRRSRSFPLCGSRPAIPNCPPKLVSN
jgi:hypothetical protein